MLKRACSQSSIDVGVSRPLCIGVAELGVWEE